MGCGGDIKEVENKPNTNTNNNLNSNENNKVNNNAIQNQNANKENQNQNTNYNDNAHKIQPENNEENQSNHMDNKPKQEQSQKKVENQNLKQPDNKEDKQKEKPKKNIHEEDLDTTDFNEDDFPMFQSNYYEKFIQNIRKTIIEKTADGTLKINKLYITMDHQKKKAKVIKIEKEENGDNKKKHLIQKIFNEDCKIEKFRDDIENSNEEFQIDTKQIFSNANNTDIYIVSQKVNNYINRFSFFYNKSRSDINIYEFQGNKMSYSTSNQSMSNRGPEEVIEAYNEQASQYLDYKKQIIKLIDDQDYDESKFNQFHKEGLKMHNYYRALHHAPDLKLNAELCEIAQKYAEYLAANRLFEHSHARFKGASMGENLFMCSGYKPDGGAGVTSWYDEIKDYDFQNHCSTGGVVGHFTQVVWKGSQYLGIGIGQNGNSYYVVANYYPAGNWVGQDAENVLPK